MPAHTVLHSLLPAGYRIRFAVPCSQGDVLVPISLAAVDLATG